MIKKADVDIWRCLLEKRNEDVYLHEIKANLGMSDRQIMLRISRVGMPYVEKTNDFPVTYRLVCDIDEAEEATIDLLSKYLGYPRSDICELINNVSDVGMMSLDMIDYNQEISRRDASYILHTCPIIQVSKGVKNNFIRVAD